MDKKVEILINSLKKSFDNRLESVISYGNCEKVNLIVILDELKAADLKAASPYIKKFKDAKHFTPVFMDIDNWHESQDVYPMESLDILTKYEILHGKDVVSSITLEKCNIRRQCEYELKNVLFHIRTMYLENADPKFIEKVISADFSRIIRIAKSVLYFLDEKIPENNESIMTKIAEKSGIDKDLFLLLVKISENKDKLNKNELEQTIQKLLDSFNQLLKYIDELGKNGLSCL